MGNGSVVYATCRNVVKDKPSPFSLAKSISKNSRKMTGDVHIKDYLNHINNFINK